MFEVNFNAVNHTLINIFLDFSVSCDGIACFLLLQFRWLEVNHQQVF